LTFAGFELDLGSERLMKGGEAVSLRRKPFLILSYLARNPRRVVTREELIAAVWGNSAMCESLIRTHVRDLRRALGGGIVDTVVGRGYRFDADVMLVGDWPPPSACRSQRREQTRAVGRDAELGILRRALERVDEDGPKAVFVPGAFGVGKTTLADHFASDAAARTLVHIGRGACIESYGTDHPYLSVLDALGALCRGPRAYRVIDVLAHYAPAWLAQLPGVVRGERLTELQRWSAGSTRAQMLNELGVALEVLSSEAPILLLLEDLHWADASTAEVLAFICQRRTPLRCLILGTFRPAEISRSHPLSRVVGELIAHGHAFPLELRGFDAASLDDYLVARFPGHSFSFELTDSLLRASGGNPLLIGALLDDLQDRAAIIRRQDGWHLVGGVAEIDACKPEGVLRLLDGQIDRLSELEQQVLEVGSATGMTFTGHLVAHALNAPAETVDACCETLAHKHGLLDVVGTEIWADGSTPCRYRFRQSLTHAALLRRSPASSVRSWKRKIAELLAPADRDRSV
jgi:DNA-binding winged helix-turn-helix (wHTH) protein